MNKPLARFCQILFVFLIHGMTSYAYAVDNDGDGLDDSFETCDGNYVPGVTSGTCSSVSSCGANTGCITTNDYDGDGSFDNAEFIIFNTDPSTDDLDGDGLFNAVDNCHKDVNPNQLDFDNDGIGNACDPDFLNYDDGDGIPAAQDNCPFTSNPSQVDTDNDGMGDACDPDADADGDGLTNAYEISIGTSTSNPDTDGDGVDDGTEDASGTDPLDVDTDNDGVYDIADMFPNDNTRILACVPGDANGDGVINTADLILVREHVLGNASLSCQ